MSTGSKPLYGEIHTMLAEANQVIEAWQEKASIRDSPTKPAEIAPDFAGDFVGDAAAAELVRRTPSFHTPTGRLADDTP